MVQNRPTIKREDTKITERLRRKVVGFEEIGFKLGVKDR
jgi:hypothetical protein